MQCSESTSEATDETGNSGATTENPVAPDAPLVAADPDVWHPMRCGRVRDADDVQTVVSVGQRQPCPWCQLFVDLSEVGINGV
jgi:hypothetical protein